jgi:endonuclease/exonuclease/phosphatase family metal-dependent hydrolase
LPVAVLGAGIIAALTVVYFGFAAPNVIAGWTRGSYPMICALLVGSAVGWAILLHQTAIQGMALSGAVKVAGLLFTFLLMVTIAAHQTSFSGLPAEYPLPEASVSASWSVTLVLMLLLWPVVAIALGGMMASLSSLRPSAGQLGLAFGLGGVFLLAVCLGQIFTTTYDYMPVIGPLFRDRFWLVIAAPAAVSTAALFAAPGLHVPAGRATGRALLGVMAVLAFLTPVGLFVVRPDLHPPASARALTLATFNVEQGYDLKNQRNFDGQLAFLKTLGADILGLQESDTNRVAGGNDDLVRYLARGLNLHAYYGPKTANGTFGIALLSRYPIESARTFYLYSEGEQTAVVTAEVIVGEKTYSILVTHLGNGGPLLQLQQVLNLVDSSRPVVLLGDFNFRPESEQYRVVTDILNDGWAKRWPSGVQGNGYAPAKRIDYVFVSPAIGIRDARDIANEESDHPALVVTVE